MTNHTFGQRYLQAVGDQAKAESLKYWNMFSREERIRLMREPDHLPPLHWTVGACLEIGADPLAVHYGDQYYLRGFHDPTGIVEERLLDSAKNMVGVADQESWSWQKRVDLWDELAQPIFGRTMDLSGQEPLTKTTWRRAGKHYDDTLAAEAPEESGQQLRVFYECQRCGEPVTSSVCPNCKLERSK